MSRQDLIDKSWGESIICQLREALLYSSTSCYFLKKSLSLRFTTHYTIKEKATFHTFFKENVFIFNFSQTLFGIFKIKF